MTSYSYSLDRELWLGRFDSRREAMQAGVPHGLRENIPPETVYVGQRIEPDLRAYGHARAILESIRRRVRDDNGELAEGFLKKLNDRQIAELDDALENTIRQWMRKYDLEPSWVRVEAVGEYPMPTPVGAIHGERSREVNEIGVEDAVV